MRVWAPEEAVAEVVAAWFGQSGTTWDLYEELRARHRGFKQALLREDVAGALLRYHERAILWPQDRLPVIGRDRIRELLAGMPDLLGAAAFRPLSVTLRGTRVLERGELGRGAERRCYQCVWQRQADGRLLVLREAWDHPTGLEIN